MAHRKWEKIASAQITLRKKANITKKTRGGEAKCTPKWVSWMRIASEKKEEKTWHVRQGEANQKNEIKKNENEVRKWTSCAPSMYVASHSLRTLVFYFALFLRWRGGGWKLEVCAVCILAHLWMSTLRPRRHIALVKYFLRLGQGPGRVCSVLCTVYAHSTFSHFRQMKCCARSLGSLLRIYYPIYKNEQVICFWNIANLMKNTFHSDANSSTHHITTANAVSCLTIRRECMCGIRINIE